jgi:hypothetical protein
MDNDLLGPKAWAYVCETLGLGKEFDWKCQMIATSVDCDVVVDIEHRTIGCDLPAGVRFVQMLCDNEYVHGIVNFGSMDPKE